MSNPSGATCPSCESSNVTSERREVEFERGGSVEALVFTCSDCSGAWVAEESTQAVAMAMAARPLDQSDRDFLANLDEAGKAELQLIAKLARRAFPTQEEYVTFFAAPNRYMEKPPGEMVNTAEGREEVKEFLALVCAMKEGGQL